MNTKYIKIQIEIKMFEKCVSTLKLYVLRCKITGNVFVLNLFPTIAGLYVMSRRSC